MITLQQIADFISTPVGQILLGLLGVSGLSIAWLLKHALKPLKSLRSLLERYKDYEVNVVKFEDIERVHKFMSQYVGDNISPLPHWQERHQKNPNTLYMVERVQKKGQKETRIIQGVFSVIPVTRAARDLLSRNQLTAGKFRLEHVCNPKGKPSALYVSILLGANSVSRGIVIASIKNIIKTQKQEQMPIFTRPTTNDAIRVARKLGFVPVVPTGADARLVIHRYA